MMKIFRADLHIHSVLSPCGSLDMSPVNIIREARRKKIDILAMTDHNATQHCRLMMELGSEEGILVIPGAEVNTAEEIHCLTLFETLDDAEKFQQILTAGLAPVKNDPSLFGEQLVVDREERILNEVEPLLIGALGHSIYEVREQVARLGGLFIPAHIDRPYNSLISQLGFIPEDLEADAFEISARSHPGEFTRLHPELTGKSLIQNSDAHDLPMIGQTVTKYLMEEASFSELKMALRNTDGRKILSE
ncbi:MAG: PHP domain-containing protein [Bacteroidales bacterium]|nr:PHP domain-containing protein [Bacteroidales bacterium]